jgi:hypothetical protein
MDRLRHDAQRDTPWVGKGVMGALMTLVAVLSAGGLVVLLLPR